MAGSKSKINKSAIAEGARSVKYTAQELTIDRMPFTTNTVTNTLNMAKDLREWTRRNNPFKAVNGNKDPLVRQIANASMKGLKAAQQDLLHGDLRFSRLNKEFRAFVGGEDPEHMFDYMDMDFGDFDYGGSDGEEGNEDRTMVAMGQSISREFTDTQMAATSATISAVETATDRISTVSLRASEVATNRLISANLANMSRLSTQIGQVSGELVTVNQNLSLLVQQGNDINQFLGQSQKFMENTEQSLNDIKALLEVIAAPQQQGQNKRRPDREPEWIQNGFDVKGYLKDKMSNTMTGMAVSTVVGKAFNALHLEVPSFIDQSMVTDLSDLKPLNATLSKLLPAINRFAHVDKMIEGAFKTVLAKIEEGEYVKGGTFIGDLLYNAGLDGWGYNPNGRRKLFNLANYNKGSISWNGKSERALQEVIPSYLSNIEGYLKNIAEGLDADRAARNGTTPGIKTDQFRIYDYENGSFTSLEKLRKEVQQAYNETAQSAFSGIMSKIQDNVHTGDRFNREINAVFNELLKDETRVSDPANAAKFKRVLQKYRKDGKLSDGEIMSLFNELTLEVKPNAIKNLSEFRKNTNERENSYYHLGEEELWKLRANVQFKTTADVEQEERDKIYEKYKNDETLRNKKLKEYDDKLEKAKREKEMSENSWLKRKIKSTDAGKQLFDIWEDLQKHGGPINRMIEYAQDYGIINPLLSLVHGVKGYAEGTGIEGLKGDQVIAGHNKEIILTREQSDMIRWFSGKHSNEISKMIKHARAKRRAPANDVERKFSSVVHNANVEKAQTREDEVYERYCEFTDNIASIAAVTQNSVETEKQENSKAAQDKMNSFIFGEKDENGFYHGKMFSDLGNMVLDFKNMVNHAFTGEAYTTSAGNKVAKTDDCLKGNIGKSLATAGDAAARTIFGENYKDSKFYKGVHGYFSDFSAGLKATYNGEEVNDEFWEKRRIDKKVQSELSSYMKLSPEKRRRYEQNIVFKKQGLDDMKGYLEEAYNEDSAIDSDDPEFIAQLDKRAAQLENINNEIARLSRKLEWIDKFNETNTSGEESDAVKQANLALFGVENIEDAGKSISEATQETAKAGSTAHDKLLRGIKFGLGGAIGVTAAKYLGLGAIPSFFLPGGPIGGAILGVGVSILSKNKTFMAHLFGGEDNEGNKVDGIISKDLQDKFKTAGKKILGPATIGAIGGLVFPKAVGAISSHLGLLGGLVGTGPIGGAVLASGAALLLGSTQLKEKLFGKDENGKATGIISKSIAKGKEFLSNNKDALKRAGLGTLGGALLGTKMFGLTGLALGPTILGTAIGISSMSSKFTDYLFGTKIMTKDKDGNTVWTRDGDGLFGRISRMVSVNVLAPIKSFVANGADRLVEYIKHDIGFSIRSIFSPFTIPIKDAVDNLSKSFKKIGDKATKLAKKFFDPLLKVGGGLLKGLTKFNLGVAKFGMHIAGNIIASPLKLLGGIGNLFTKNKSSKIKKANRDFRRGYFDENGKYQAGIIGKFINPLAWGERILKKTNTKGIGNKISGFFEAINPFEAYAEERQNFAKKRGLEKDTAFTGGLFGAEWKRHKDAEKMLDKQEIFDKTQVSLAQEWAKNDRYNNKIQLSNNELKRRNDALRKAYAKANLKYTNMSNEQMMQFIYDPLGKRGINKEKMLAREEERHAEMKSIVETIRDTANEIADVLTGRKRKMTDKQRKYLEKRKAREKKKKEEAFEALAKDPNAPDIDYDSLTFGQKIALRWKNYVDRAWDGTVGKAQRGIRRIKRRGISIAGHVKRGVSNARDTIDQSLDTAWNTLAGIGNGTKKAVSIAGKGLKGAGKFFSNGLQKFSDWATMSTEEREAARSAKSYEKTKLNINYSLYKTKFKNNKKRISQLLKEVESGRDPKVSEEEAESLGLDTTKNLADEIRKKAKSMKLLSKRGFAKIGGMEKGGMKVALSAAKGSLMEMLLNKKSVLVGLGTAAIGIGITALVTKFPKIIDWFKDDFIPFIQKDLWPFLKDTVTGLLNGIGAALMGIGDFVRGGQKATTKFLNFMSSGTWEDPLTTEAKNQLNHENGLLTNDEMKAYVQNKANVATIVGKSARDDLANIDYLAAALAYTGHLYRSDHGSANDVTANEILTYLRSSNSELNRKGRSIAWITNGVYNKILNKCAPEELAKGHSRWQNFSEADLTTAATMAAKYLNEDKAAASQMIENILDEGLTVEGTETSVGSGHFMQTDPRWRNRRYANSRSGYSTIGNGGCGPTALANVAVQNGIRTNPVAVASMAQSSGYTAQGGSNARLFSEGASRLGLRSTAIGKGGIKRALSNGKSVIFAGRGHGFYTGAGHIMSARGLDNHGNAIVDDPLRRKSLSVPLSKISNGLTNAWSIGRGIADYEADKAVAQANSISVDAIKNANKASAESNSVSKAVDEYIANNEYAQKIMASGNATAISEMRKDIERRLSSGSESSKYKDMYNLMRKDSLSVSVGESWNPAYYAQVDDAWKTASMSYESGTYGSSGCVVSALGSLLANITGLNYRPDIFDKMTSGVYSTGGLVGMLQAALPPSLQGKRAYRLRIENQVGTAPSSKFSYPDSIIKPKLTVGQMTHSTHLHAIDTGNPNSSTSYKYNTAERIFEDNVFTNPFVLYGGTTWRSGIGWPKNDVFKKGDGSGTYSQHAVLVIPSAENRKDYGAESRKIRYYVLNPGTGQNTVGDNGFRTGINTGTEFTFDELFAKKQGIESMFVIDGAVPSPNVLKTYTEGSVNIADGDWFNSIYDQSKYFGKVKEYTGNKRSSSSQDVADRAAALANAESNDSGSSGSDGSSESSGNFLTKLTAALGKLGNIAMNILGSIFGGEYKSVYDGTSSSSSSSSGSSGSNGGGGINYSAPTIDIPRDENGNFTGSDADTIRIMNEVITKTKERNDGDLTVPEYNTLPEWATNFQSNSVFGTALPSSSKLTPAAIQMIENATSALVMAHECKGDYTSAINDCHYLSLGINGFHKENASEILNRMAASGKMDEADKESAINIAEWAKSKYDPSTSDLESVKSLLGKNLDVTKYAQAGLLHQLNNNALQYPLQMYDAGIIKDPRSIVAIAQFAGFGVGHTQKFANKEASKFKAGYYSDDELTNTIIAMDTYYKSNVNNYRTYLDGMRNRMKLVYGDLGGNYAKGAGDVSYNSALGFGGGIRDSYNTTGYYDSVDTPVAINSVPKVEIVDEPITSRLDIIIDCLRRMVAQANSSGATTAKDNLDIGRGLANDMKMKYAGLDRKETLPVYKKDTTNIDRMRDIHNKIARSPRSM